VGHTYGAGNSFVRALVSNWQVSGIETYESGLPLGTAGANCDASDTASCYASFAPAFTGPERINGSYGSGNLIGSNLTSYLNPALKIRRLLLSAIRPPLWLTNCATRDTSTKTFRC
jgi:hypothetical protein